MSEGSIKEVDDAMEKLAREGVGFFFGFSKLHGCGDSFVNAQVCS